MKYDVYLDGKFMGTVEADNIIDATTDACIKFTEDDHGEHKLHLRAWG